MKNERKQNKSKQKRKMQKKGYKENKRCKNNKKAPREDAVKHGFASKIAWGVPLMTSLLRDLT